MNFLQLTKRRLALFKTCGLKNVSIGTLKSIYYSKLQKKYGFEQWHRSPIELRRYAMDIACHVNELSKTELLHTICEVGCGLGEIIRNCANPEKFGYDLDPKVIEAAKYLDRKSESKVQYSCCAFGEEWVPEQRSIDCLITVNFIHSIDKETLTKTYRNINNNANVHYLIVDSCGSGYKYSHRFQEILPSNFKLYKRLGPYEMERTVEIYKNDRFNDNESVLSAAHAE